jgi:2'-5' RNA ligase
MPRLFTGLEVPQAVSTVLAGLRGGLSGARWITPDHYHVTLRFFGDVDGACARALDDLIAQARHDPFVLTVSGLHIFGGDRPRALVATITPHPALTELQAEQERLARRLGLEPETRKFSPHITLARLRDVNAYQVAAFLSMLGPFPPLPLAVDRCVMFSARDQVGGGHYVVEAVYPFGAETDEDEEAWAYADRAG